MGPADQRCRRCDQVSGQDLSGGVVRTYQDTGSAWVAEEHSGIIEVYSVDVTKILYSLENRGQSSGG